MNLKKIFVAHALILALFCVLATLAVSILLPAINMYVVGLQQRPFQTKSHVPKALIWRERKIWGAIFIETPREVFVPGMNTFPDWYFDANRRRVALHEFPQWADTGDTIVDGVRVGTSSIGTGWPRIAFISTMQKDRLQIATKRGAEYIPLTPRWTGIVYNAAIISTCTVMAYASIFIGRVGWRRCRYRCIWCGYPIMSSTVCSECGKKNRGVW